MSEHVSKTHWLTIAAAALLCPLQELVMLVSVQVWAAAVSHGPQQCTMAAHMKDNNTRAAACPKGTAMRSGRSAEELNVCSVMRQPKQQQQQHSLSHTSYSMPGAGQTTAAAAAAAAAASPSSRVHQCRLISAPMLHIAAVRASKAICKAICKLQSVRCQAHAACRL
jgi:hypothetical protein